MEKYATDIIAKQMQMLGGLGAGHHAPQEEGHAEPAAPAPAAAAPPGPKRGSKPAAKGGTPAPVSEAEDEKIPF